LLHLDPRAEFARDQAGVRFPWIPRPINEILKDAVILERVARPDGTVARRPIKWAEVLTRSPNGLALHFASVSTAPTRDNFLRFCDVYAQSRATHALTGSWSPVSAGSASLVVSPATAAAGPEDEATKKKKAAAPPFEVVYVGLLQQDPAGEFDRIFNEMPWPYALPAQGLREETRAELLKALLVQSLGTVATIDGTGAVMERNAGETALLALDLDAQDRYAERMERAMKYLPADSAPPVATLDAAHPFPWLEPDLVPLRPFTQSKEVLTAAVLRTAVVLYANDAPNKSTPLAEFAAAAHRWHVLRNPSLQREDRVSCFAVDSDAQQREFLLRLLDAVGADRPKHGQPVLIIISVVADLSVVCDATGLDANGMLARIEAFRERVETLRVKDAREL
jgi:hypothetical protein